MANTLFDEVASLIPIRYCFFERKKKKMVAKSDFKISFHSSLFYSCFKFFGSTNETPFAFATQWIMQTKRYKEAQRQIKKKIFKMIAN